ncbi:iron ABC transporter permease [Peribacillus cavernae]|uniref:Iron ABC transporter permease n=1 Tax=Peribacillus cavernae TaxID=1674310 RepID=A0A3S0V857_9BACI|nr:iron ABC transporter permease [Peribacillus cavernae]MDQ0219692.1 iron complex transport system permease protein [Peribacillus cavernae]RUQ25971.1 iron ABC transporter permease [Peribacillus cavernae]
MNKYKSFRLFNGFISMLLDKKTAAIFTGLLFLLIFTFLLSAGTGQLYISPLDVAKAILGFGSKLHTTVITSFRLPRIMVAMMVGMALAVAGGILQGIIRNPLASPDIIGLTSGASFAVVSFLALFSTENNALTVSISWLPIAAFAGAAITAFLVYFLAWKNGVSPVRLVLIGIGISALMQAGTTTMMILGPIYRASQANIWITGSVNGSKWTDASIVTPLVLVLMGIAFMLVRHLNVQELGEDIARGVGSKVQKQRLLLLLIATALTGSAVAFAGGIGFVGLMAPHIARRLVGSAFGALLPVAALIGAVLVIIADLAGRTLFDPLEIPAGVFTASIGAPYFIYLLYKTRNS